MCKVRRDRRRTLTDRRWRCLLLWTLSAREQSRLAAATTHSETAIFDSAVMSTRPLFHRLYDSVQRMWNYVVIHDYRICNDSSAIFFYCVDHSMCIQQRTMAYNIWNTRTHLTRLGEFSIFYRGGPSVWPSQVGILVDNRHDVGSY